MIYIDPHAPNIIKAKNAHLEGLIQKIKTNVNNLPQGELKIFLNDLRIRKILSDLPQNLITHHEQLLDALPGYSQVEWIQYLRIKKHVKQANRNNVERDIYNRNSDLTSQINSIFEYTGGFARKTSPYSAYDLAENLNIQTCVYCNRIYTKTVRNPSKVTRPEFDHWYPKESYPILALSFYNLLPSCHVCNSGVKGSEIMSLNDFIHPYVDKEINFKFSYWIEKYNTYKFKIKRNVNSKEDNTIKAFKLEDIYKTHKDEIHDMVRLKKMYSVDYLLKLRKMLSRADENVSIEELYRLAFGTYLKEDKFHKRPLSRMKKDILEELGMIKSNK